VTSIQIAAMRARRAFNDTKRNVSTFYIHLIKKLISNKDLNGEFEPP